MLKSSLTFVLFLLTIISELSETQISAVSYTVYS